MLCNVSLSLFLLLPNTMGIPLPRRFPPPFRPGFSPPVPILKKALPILLAWAALRLVYTSNFCRPLRCNFSRKWKLAAISLRLRVRCFRTCSKHVRYSGDNSHRNCFEIAASLHARCNSATWARQKHIENCDKSWIKNRMCKRAFILRWTHNAPVESLHRSLWRLSLDTFVWDFLDFWKLGDSSSKVSQTC